MIELKISRQTFDFDCGAKALQTVLAYYGVEMREDALIKELGADDEGTPPDRMVAVAVAKGFNVDARACFSLDEVKAYVDQGHPVIVLLQAWADRYMTLDDWAEDYDDGHYAIVIGHVGSVIIFEDPASFRRTWLTDEEFLVRWHDMHPHTKQRHRCFGIVLLGREPVVSDQEHARHMD